MAINAKPRTKDHWTLRLRIKRPSTAGRGMLFVFAAIEAVLLFFTASGFARGGGLYACASPCGTPAQPATPLLAVIFGIAIFILPAIIGLYSESWPEAVAITLLAWFVAVIFTATSWLASPATFSTSAGKLTSTFPTPFWLDSGRVLPLLFSLMLFAALAWFGWLLRETLSDA